MIEIYDTTLRDGEQAPGAAMHPSQKVEVALELQTLGVDTIEAGFPSASAKDAESVAEIARLCRGCRIAAFGRTTREDIEMAIEAIRHAEHPRITLVMPSSDLHLQSKLRINHEEALELLPQMVTMARNQCAEVEVIAEDSTRSRPEFLGVLFQTAVKAGARFFTLADTVGYATPEDIRMYFRRLHEMDIGGVSVTFGIHCHDDLGLATINTITGLEAGATQAHCTVNGIGERAGNAALEEIVMAISLRSDRFPFEHRLDTTRLWTVSRMVSNTTNFLIPPNKAIVGSNAFAHGAGLHQDGMLKDTNMYEIMSPASVGAPGRTLPITRHSGRKGLNARLHELNITLEPAEVDTLYAQIQDVLANQKFLSDADLVRAVAGLR